MNDKAHECLIDIHEILEMLPHRYPLLLVDRVIGFESENVMRALKNVTINEPFFVGHFPQKPIMPGVLIIEAIAQSAALFVCHKLGDEAKGKLVYFMSIEQAKFRRPVSPGDQMILQVTKIRQHKNVWKFKGDVFVDSKKVAEATVTAMIDNKR